MLTIKCYLDKSYLDKFEQHLYILLCVTVFHILEQSLPCEVVTVTIKSQWSLLQRMVTTISLNIYIRQCSHNILCVQCRDRQYNDAPKEVRLDCIWPYMTRYIYTDRPSLPVQVVPRMVEFNVLIIVDVLYSQLDGNRIVGFQSP